MYDVENMWDWTVKKIPRTTRHTSAIHELVSLHRHKDNLGLYIPETEIYKWPEAGFEVHQELVEWTPVDLAVEMTNEQIRKLLDWWREMQNREWVLFDIFWIQWMIKLFNYYFQWTGIKKMSDLLLPANAKYLRMMHNFPERDLVELNKKWWNPFIAHNIIKEADWNMKFIDTDNRPLDPFHPLNLVWNWITQKALKDLQNKK